MTSPTVAAPGAAQHPPLPPLPVSAAARPDPRSYVHQMRSERHRWWRPVLALLLAVACFVGAMIGTYVVGFVVWGMEAEHRLLDPVNPWGFLATNLLLAALIPATMLGLWIGCGVPPGRVLSVAGGMRWGWLTTCFAVVTPLWAAYLGAAWFVTGGEVDGRAEQWIALLLVGFLTTPLQAAGEELAFRGGLVQGVGAWLRSPWVGLVVTTVLSSALFALAHGSMDVWILLELAFFAAAACWLTWRTGGLEAAITLHVVNNVLLLSLTIMLGGLSDAYIDEASTGDPLSTALGVAITAIATILLLRVARRRGIAPVGWREPAVG